MAGSVNKVILIGNLGQDPEVKSFQNGGRIANLRIATSESWKDKQTGERKERTEWHTVVLQSDGLVGVAERYPAQGQQGLHRRPAAHPQVAGPSGNDRYTTEVSVGGIGGVLTMLDGAPGGAAAVAVASAGGGDWNEGGSSGVAARPAAVAGQLEPGRRRNGRRSRRRYSVLSPFAPN